VWPYDERVLAPGDQAPPIALPDAHTGEVVADPWSSGRTVLAFFKVTCPVCHMVAPKVAALSDAGVDVVAVGEDPPAKLVAYARDKGQRVRTLSEAPPYPVSSAYGLQSVPTLFLVNDSGTVEDVVAGWDREGWNRLAAAAGAPPVSEDGDGLPVYRPG
jgi:peroxiredoxin